MKFTVDIKDTTSIFYKVCRNNGQAMGQAIPYLLEESSIFKLIFTDTSNFLEDAKGATYKTHFSKNDLFNISPSYMIGSGRKFDAFKAVEYIRSFDFHLFANVRNGVVSCNVLSAKMVEELMGDNGFVEVIS